MKKDTLTFLVIIVLVLIMTIGAWKKYFQVASIEQSSPKSMQLKKTDTK